MAAAQHFLRHSRLRQPAVNFHRTSKFKEAQSDFDKEETVAVILEGISGSGKSEIALNLAVNHEQKLKSDGNSNYIICMVNSSSEEMLKNDLQSFCGDLKLNLKISCASHFKDIYEALNKEPFAETRKLFLFDDMNLQEKNSESMLVSTVLACLRYLTNGDRAHKGKWKFIVTTKHGFREDLSLFEPAAKKFHIEGFTEMDALQFFKGSELPEDKIRKLRKLMLGSPLALRIAKKELRDQSVEEYIAQVEDCADQYLADDDDDQDAYQQGNVIASIAKSLRSLVREKDKEHVSDLLRCILFYNENNITEQLLLSCMEIIAPKKKMNVLKNVVSKFCDKLYDLFLATKDGNNGKNGFTVHQLVMKALRLLVRRSDPIDEQQSNCRLALTALCRCLDVDGRFHEKFSMNTSTHATSIVKFLTERIEEQPTFCDVTIKIMHAALLCAISYADVRTRARFAQGQRRLLKARDDICMLVCGKDFAKLKEKAGSDTDAMGIPQKIGEKLYNGCKKLMPDAAYKHYVRNVSLFQRLTERDLVMLGLNRAVLKNDHLSESELDKLQEAGKALKNDTMEQIYAAEFTASIFFLLARLHGFATEDAERRVLLQDSIEYSQVAMAIYDKVALEHDVIILNKVILRRSEELPCKMKLMAGQPEEDRVKAILNEFEALSGMEGNAFENGLLRSVLQRDHYHQMLCQEGMLRAYGLLYRAGVEESLDQGNRLFETCKEHSNQEMRKDSCLSILHQHYADFLHSCNQYEKAITMLVQSVKFLGKAKATQNTPADNPRPEILEGRFTELCDMMGKYVDSFNQQVNLPQEDRDYLEDICDACRRREKIVELPMLRKVLDGPRRMQQPTEEMIVDSSSSEDSM